MARPAAVEVGEEEEGALRYHLRGKGREKGGLLPKERRTQFPEGRTAE